MPYLEIAMIIAMIALGVLCAVNDLRYGIIPNKYVKLGLVIIVCSNVIYATMGGVPYFRTWGINYFLAATLSIFLYFAGIWAAGDTKLFIILYGLIPARFFEEGSLTSAIVPFILIFLPAYIWIIVDSIKRMISGEKRYRSTIDIKGASLKWLRVVIEAFAFNSIICGLIPEFVSRNMLFSATLMMIYAMICSQWSIMNKTPVIIVHIALLIILSILGFIILPLPKLYAYPLFLALYTFQLFLASYNYQELRCALVKPGLILSATSVMRFQSSRVQGLPSNMSEGMDARLSVSEADAVRRWEHSSQGSPTVTIVRKVPFGIMILIGFVLWVITIGVRWSVV